MRPQADQTSTQLGNPTLTLYTNGTMTHEELEHGKAGGTESILHTGKREMKETP